jgi:hypothetical protein
VPPGTPRPAGRRGLVHVSFRLSECLVLLLYGGLYEGCVIETRREHTIRRRHTASSSAARPRPPALSSSIAPCSRATRAVPSFKNHTARAENRRFWLLSALHPHT